LAPIAILNKKGYFTEFCCAGHCHNIGREGGTYILFGPSISLPNLPKFFEEKIFRDRVQIYREINDKDMVIRQLDVATNSMNLIIWADNLPLFQDTKTEAQENV
jgi:hypothetical protein